MAKSYILKTGGGNTILPSTAQICMELPDGKGSEVDVRTAIRYAGKARVAFETKYIRKDSTELEKAALNPNLVGPCAVYRISHSRLHTPEGQPVLSSILKDCYLESGYKTPTQFLDHAYEALVSNADRMGFETVKRDSIKAWYDGDIRAPWDWRNFRGLSSLADNGSIQSAKEFLNFYADFLAYRADPRIGATVEGNLYYAFLMWKGCRWLFGLKGQGIRRENIKEDDENDEPKEKNPAQIDLNPVKELLQNVFFKDIGSETSLVPLFSVEELPDEQVPKKEPVKKTIDNLIGKGVYVVKEDKLPLLRKDRSELCTDLAVIERTLISAVFSYALPLTGNLPGQHKLYIAHSLEEKIRYIEYEKRHLGLEKEQAEMCEKLARDIYKKAFEEGAADMFYRFQVGSFAKVRDMRDMLAPFYPEEVERWHICSVNRRSTEILMENAANRDERRGYELSLRKLDTKIRLLRPFVINNECLPKKTMLIEAITALGFRGQIMADKTTREDIFSLLNLPSTPEGENKAREILFTQDEIFEILKRYNVEYMAHENINIILLNKIFPYPIT